MPVRAAHCVVILSALLFGAAAAAQQTEKVRPTLTVSKATTRITEPLTADGWPDYIGALNQQLGAGVTPENNAVVMFYRALGPTPDGTEQPDRFFDLLGIARPPRTGDYFVDYDSFLTDEAGLAPGGEEFQQAFDQFLPATMRPWTAEQYPRVAEWLRSNEKPLALVVEGTRRPLYFSPLVSSNEDGLPAGLISVLLPGVQEARALARALCARALLRSAAGETEAAQQDLLACHRLGRLTGQGPTLIEGLVAIAIDAMAASADLAFVERARPEATAIQRFSAELDRLPPLPRMADKIDLGERYMFLDSVLMIARGDKQTMELIQAEGAAARLLARLSVNAIDWDIVLKLANQVYDRLVAALRQEDRRERDAATHVALDEMEALVKEARDPQALQKLAANAKNPREALSQLVARATLGLLLPAVTQAVTAEDVARQRMRNLQVALALAAFRHEQGRFPQELRELSPRYLEDIPPDWFSGRPLLYKPSAAGYVLYSVGPNAVDDGGRDRTADPEGDDVVIRVPLP